MNPSRRAFSWIAYTLLVSLVLFSACSKEGNQGGSGNISFTIKMPPLENETLYREALFACDEYGIADVVAQVSYGGQPVASGGPWPCNTGEGIISGVEEGQNYLVTISLRDTGGQVRFRGTSEPVDVVAGQTTDAGTIEVTSTNDAPVFAVVANQQVNEGVPVSFTVSATDPNGDAMTYGATSLPVGAQFDPGTGMFYWIPGFDQSGTYTATFQVTDDGSPPLSDTLSVTITVGDTINHPPVLTVPAGPVLFTPGVPYSFSISATDPDGDALTYDVAYMPQDWYGTYIMGPTFNPVTRIFTWPYPDDADIDEYRVLFIVTDDGTPRMADYEWVTLQVYTTVSQLTNSRYPVLADIGSRQVAAGEAIQFYVSATDPDANPLSYSASAIPGKTAPSNYSFTDVVFGSFMIKLFSWSSSTPGNYWLRFTATDTADHAGYGLSDSEDVVFTIGNVNRPPILNPIGRRYVVNGDTISFVVTATDPENDSLTYSASSAVGAALPANATFDAATQTFTWNVIDVGTGTYTIRFTVTDDGTPAESDYEDVPIQVQ